MLRPPRLDLRWSLVAVAVLALIFSDLRRSPDQAEPSARAVTFIPKLGDIVRIREPDLGGGWRVIKLFADSDVMVQRGNEVVWVAASGVEPMP